MNTCLYCNSPCEYTGLNYSEGCTNLGCQAYKHPPPEEYSTPTYTKEILTVANFSAKKSIFTKIKTKDTIPQIEIQSECTKAIKYDPQITQTYIDSLNKSKNYNFSTGTITITFEEIDTFITNFSKNVSIPKNYLFPIEKEPNRFVFKDEKLKEEAKEVFKDFELRTKIYYE